LLLGQRGDLVISPAQFERTYRLLAFKLQIKFAIAVGDQFCPRDNAAETRLGITDVVECDYRIETSG